MHIDSLNLIVSVSRSRNDYYKPERTKECRITINRRHILKTPKNSESARRFAPNCLCYTALHNDALLFSKATKQNDFIFETVVKKESFVLFPFLKSEKYEVTTHGSREVVTW